MNPKKKKTKNKRLCMCRGRDHKKKIFSFFPCDISNLTERGMKTQQKENIYVKVVLAHTDRVN